MSSSSVHSRLSTAAAVAEEYVQSTTAETENDENDPSNRSRRGSPTLIHEEQQHVLVGVSQVELFPSERLQEEERYHWLVSAMCGWCWWFEDQENESLDCLPLCTPSTASETNPEQVPNPYLPPATTWSQPAMIVPPEPSQEERGGKAKKGKNTPALARTMLLHGRVAQALGVTDGDLIRFRLEGQGKPQVVKASVDNAAAFNVVLEDRWENIPHLRIVHLALPSEKELQKQQQQLLDTEGDWILPGPTAAAFGLTPTDGRKMGVLSLDGSSTVTAHAGLLSASGFCIASCDERLDSDLFNCEDDIGSSPVRHGTALVHGFRYLGRPYCTNHAEYAALIEGLEWLLRFDFTQVWIMGVDEVLENFVREQEKEEKNQEMAVRSEGTNKQETTVITPYDESEKDEDESEEEERVPLPLQKAHATAQSLLRGLKAHGTTVTFHPMRRHHNATATNLATTALQQERNETLVHWRNIQEAKTKREFLDWQRQRAHEQQERTRVREAAAVVERQREEQKRQEESENVGCNQAEQNPEQDQELEQPAADSSAALSQNPTREELLQTTTSLFTDDDIANVDEDEQDPEEQKEDVSVTLYGEDLVFHSVMEGPVNFSAVSAPEVIPCGNTKKLLSCFEDSGILNYHHHRKPNTAKAADQEEKDDADCFPGNTCVGLGFSRAEHWRQKAMQQFKATVKTVTEDETKVDEDDDDDIIEESSTKFHQVKGPPDSVKKIVIPIVESCDSYDMSSRQRKEVSTQKLKEMSTRELREWRARKGRPKMWRDERQ